MTNPTSTRRRLSPVTPASLRLLLLLVALLLPIHRAAGFMERTKRVRDNFNVPCNFMDSISSAQLDDDAKLLGSAAADDAVIAATADTGAADGDTNETTTTTAAAAAEQPPAMSGYFDYEILNDTFRQPVARHQRVCVCRSRPCVRLRCPRGHQFDEERRSCVAVAALRDPGIEVLAADGSGVVRRVQLFEHFGYTVGKVCEQMSMLDPLLFADDRWQLNENGEVLVDGSPARSQHEYNLLPRWNETSGQVDYDVLVCFVGFDNHNRFAYLPYGMILSVPFLVLTFLVYAVLPDMRNAHGKSLMCYLASLASGYTLLAYLQLRPGIDNWWCRPFGYLTYFWFLSAFMWLNVISFDLWWTFRDFKGNIRGTRKFILYSLYSWGVPLAAAAFSVAMDHVDGVPSGAQPGFGQERCFIKNNRWIEFVYFHLPMMLIFVANAVFFTLTALIIRRVQQEIQRMTSKDESRRHKDKFAREKAKYGLFLRLFIVMGVTWSLESLSWLLDPHGWLFVLTDVLNCCQGLVIFVLFVLKPKVKKSLVARWHVWNGTPQDKFTTIHSTNSTAVSQTGESSMLMRGQSNKKPKDSSSIVE